MDMKKALFAFKVISFLVCLLPLSVYSVTIEVKVEGSLEQVVEDSDEPSFKELKIVGRLNSADIIYLRTGSGRIANVEKLDLSDVSLVADGGAYATISYSDNSVTMDNYVVTFYLAEENRQVTSSQSNGLGGVNHTVNYYCNNLAGAFARMKYKHVSLPSAINEIGYLMFWQCPNLETVGTAQKVDAVGEQAFMSCPNLVEFDLSQVRRMGAKAFAGCENFRSSQDGVVVLAQLDTIPDKAFASVNGVGNKAIKDVRFSTNLKHIGISAFQDCKKLESVVLPEGLESMGDNAFAYCSSLSQVSLPSTLRGLNKGMFAGTPYMQNSLVEEDRVVYWNSIALYYKVPSNIQEAEKEFVLKFREGTTEIADGFMEEVHPLRLPLIVGVTLPSSLRRIGSGAFQGCSNLKTIDLPEGLEEIADGDYRSGAFEGCGLTSIVIPSTIKKIGAYAFSGCSSLESVVFPEGLEEIASYAFEYCSKLEQIAFPVGLKTIGHDAFSNCTSLSEVTIPERVEQLGSDIFKGATIFRINYNAKDAVNLGRRGISGGKLYVAYDDIFAAERIVIGAGVRSLPVSAFASSDIKKVTFEERTDNAELIIGENCFNSAGITSIVLPKGKIEIGGGAFYCPSLTSFETLGVVTKICDTEGQTFGNQLKSVSFPDGLTYVGHNAFWECSLLTSANLGNSVKYIGEGAFAGCTSLVDVHFGEVLDSIGHGAFSSCEQLKSFNYGRKLKKIGTSAFSHCEALEKVTLPNTTEVIEGSAFAFCSSLKEISLPEGLKEIGSHALKGVPISELVIPSTVTMIGEYVISENKDLKNIIVNIPIPLEITDYTVFLDYYMRNTTLRVPAASLQAYRNTYPWSQFAKIKGIGGENADNALATSDVTLPTGKTKRMAVYLNNQATDYTAFQFELVLPAGIEIPTSPNGQFEVQKGERFEDKNQTLTVEKIADRRYRFVSVSLSNGIIKGTQGALLTMSLNALSNLQPGDYTAYIEDIVFSRIDGSKHELYDVKVPIMVVDGSYVKMGDVNDDGLVDVSDAVLTVNHILQKPADPFVLEAADLNGDEEVDVFDVMKMVNMILSANKRKVVAHRVNNMLLEKASVQEDRIYVDNFSISPGETKVVEIKLDNVDEYAAFQFDLYLPEGISLVSHNPDLGRLPETTILSASQLENGAYRFLGVAMNAEPLKGNSGAIISLTVQASETLPGGEGTGFFRNVRLSKSDGTGKKYDEIPFNVTVILPSIVTAKSYSRKYGEPNPVFEYEVEGGDLEGTPEISCDATATSPVGTYDIVVKKGSVANYNVTYVKGKLTIEKTPLAIKARTYTKKQGEAMPAFELDYDGFKNNETERVLKKRPVVTCEANEESEPGEYPVVVSGAEAQNYDISYVNGQLIVTEADPVTITAVSYTREYGDANPTFGYETEGAPLHGVPSIVCEALSTSPVGVYPIIITKGSVKNYNDHYVGGTLTITPATLTVSAPNCSREVGQENPTFTLLYEGWKNGENESVLLSKPVATTTATKDSPVGKYTITVSGGEAQNYTFNYINGVLTVTEPSAIVDLLASGQPFDIYSVTGKMIRRQATNLKGLPRGVYIINGQKVFVR